MAETPRLRVRDLYVYPLKSAAGIRLDEARLDAFGLAGDRRWMVVDARGRFLSQREQPRMALLRVSAGPSLIVSAPDMPALIVPVPAMVGGAARVEVTVWHDCCQGIDAGDEAASWLTMFIGEPCRLVYSPDDMVRPVDPTYAQPGDVTGFSDGFPLLLIGQGSLDDLNERLATKGAAAVPMNRFRPNIVIEGAAPFAEDGWRRLAVGVADGVVHLDIVKPCARCSIVPVDQATGVRGTEPLTTLATYRRRDGKVFFGQNVLHRARGLLRVGDPVGIVSSCPASEIR